MYDAQLLWVVSHHKHKTLFLHSPQETEWTLIFTSNQNTLIWKSSKAKTLHTSNKLETENLDYYVFKSFQICFKWETRSRLKSWVMIITSISPKITIITYIFCTFHSASIIYTMPPTDISAFHVGLGVGSPYILPNTARSPTEMQYSEDTLLQAWVHCFRKKNSRQHS